MKDKARPTLSKGMAIIQHPNLFSQARIFQKLFFLHNNDHIFIILSSLSYLGTNRDIFALWKQELVLTTPPVKRWCTGLSEAAVNRQAGVSMWNGSRVPEFGELCLICTTGRESSHISYWLRMDLIWLLGPKAHLSNCRRSRDTQPSIKSDSTASYSSCIVYQMSHFQNESKSKLGLTVASQFILLLLFLYGLAEFLNSSYTLLK